MMPSLLYIRRMLEPTLLALILTVSAFAAQPLPGDVVVLPAKLNAEGFSQMLIPVSGLEFRPTADHDWAIVAVASNSEAADAGLEIGDSLREINGHVAAELTLGDIQALLSRPSTPCIVRVDRHGKARTATLRLRNRL